MSTATKIKHTPQAMRAAQEICDAGYCGPYAMVAEIIDRETRLPALLVALEDAARDCGLEAGCASQRDDDHDVKAWSELQNKLDAAIRLAKGESHV